MRNNGYLNLSFEDKFNNLVNNGEFTRLDRYKDCFYINKSNLFFKEDNGEGYKELLGTKIAKYLDVPCVNYDLVCVNTFDKKINGIISNDFRINGYELIKLASVIDNNTSDNEISLDSIYYYLDKYFDSYSNKKEIVNSIMNNLIIYLSFDYLIGNIDNGMFNKELLVGNDNAMLTPYFDFGMIFNFKSTSFKFDSNSSYFLYDNINDLINSKHCMYFIDMYNKLTPDILEKIIEDVEKDINFSLPENFKNIVFLSYNRHYEIVGDLINKRKHVI